MRVAVEQEGCGQIPGQRVPSQLGPALECHGHGTVRSHAGQAGGTQLGTPQGCASGCPQTVTPLSMW